MSAIKKLNHNKINFSKLCERINKEMEKREWNYVKLAKMSSSSRETIRGICIGENSNPKINTIEAIAHALEIDVFELLGSYEAVSTIEEKNIPLYSSTTLTNLSDDETTVEKITCLVKGSDNCFAIKVDPSLEHILVTSNSMMVDIGDILIFDKEYEFKKIRNRSIVVYYSEGLPIIGEVMGVNDQTGEVFISQRKDINRNSKIDVKKQESIVALLSSTQFI